MFLISLFFFIYVVRFQDALRSHQANSMYNPYINGGASSIIRHGLHGPAAERIFGGNIYGSHNNNNVNSNHSHNPLSSDYFRTAAAVISRQSAVCKNMENEKVHQSHFFPAQRVLASHHQFGTSEPIPSSPSNQIFLKKLQLDRGRDPLPPPAAMTRNILQESVVVSRPAGVEQCAAASTEDTTALKRKSFPDSACDLDLSLSLRTRNENEQKRLKVDEEEEAAREYDDKGVDTTDLSLSLFSSSSEKHHGTTKQTIPRIENSGLHLSL